MKIKINENETYELTLPTSINIKELSVVINKLQKILKIASRDEVFGLSEEGDVEVDKTTKRRKSHDRSILNTREKALQVLRIHYHGSKEDKNEVEKIINMKWSEFSKGFHALKKRYSITPKDVGLVRFPKLGEGPIVDTLKVKNFKFKYDINLWKE